VPEFTHCLEATDLGLKWDVKKTVKIIIIIKKTFSHVFLS